MKRNTIYLFAIAAAMLCAACDEFPPVNYDDPDPAKTYTDADFAGVIFTTIADLKAMYVRTPVDLGSGIYIKGQVISSDQDGNLYRTLYIQDETGGIEVKMGTRNLYNEYKMGQWLYIDCNGLTIGSYGGMIQVGYKSAAGSSYETAYIDIQLLIDTHIFKGKQDTIEPQVITSADITNEDMFGMYVTVPNMTYGNEIFTILYDDNDNSLYLSGRNTYGITTWAITSAGFERYMERDRFGGAVSASDVNNYSPSFYNVSQYFYSSDKVDLQVRTSGYARFADYEIDPEIIAGATVNLTGILTYYNGNNQFLLNQVSDVVIVE